jgi:hypothetical protein
MCLYHLVFSIAVVAVLRGEAVLRGVLRGEALEGEAVLRTEVLIRLSASRGACAG